MELHDKLVRAAKTGLDTRALPKRRYARGFEPGCAIGILTLALAARCEQLLSSDMSSTALSHARARLLDQTHVRIEQLEMPRQWPDEKFDLVVLSEFLGFLKGEEIRQVASHARSHLLPGGTIVMCHWRHVMAHGESADVVHRTFAAALDMPRVVQHDEADFLLDVWTPDGRSVASVEAG